MVACNSGGNKQQTDTAATSESKEQATKNDGGITAANLVGKWTDRSNLIVYEFKTGGSGIISYPGDKSKNTKTFTWKIDGKKVSIDIEDGNFNQFDYTNDNQIEDMMRQKWTK